MSGKMSRIGTKAKVWHGTALKTSGGLFKSDLMKNKNGRIISIKKHKQGIEAFKRNQLKPKTKEELAAISGRKKVE